MFIKNQTLKKMVAAMVVASGAMAYFCQGQADFGGAPIGASNCPGQKTNLLQLTGCLSCAHGEARESADLTKKNYGSQFQL